MDSFSTEVIMASFGLDASRIDQVDGVSPIALRRDELEASVLRVWMEVLDVREIGLDDNFFDLGGDSLQMIRIVSRVLAISGVRIPLREFFDAPSARGNVQSLCAHGRFASEDPSVSMSTPALAESLRGDESPGPMEPDKED